MPKFVVAAELDTAEWGDTTVITGVGSDGVLVLTYEPARNGS